MVVEVSGEQPGSEWAVASGCPVGLEGSPEPGGRRADGQGPGPLRLRGAELAARDGSLDAQRPAGEVAEPQGDEFAASGAGVGGEPDEQQVLFGVVADLGASAAAVVVPAELA